MCGIVGAFAPQGLPVDWLQEACDSLRHRGPDGQGIWRDSEAGVALGHTRLAILDLSEAGRQPMASACGRYHVVFNGEIYNHLDLRDALPPRSWRGHSDTETVLACLSCWSVERTLKSLVGMFALAVFDTQERKLILARDRLGEKPLYYGYAGDAMIFASEPKTLRLAPGFDATLDRAALTLYMRNSYVPAPRSIYASLRKLPPATWMTISTATVRARFLPEPTPYWSVAEAAVNGERIPLQVGEVEAVTMLETLLARAVKGQMLADVPLGAFLSGGIDSSAIVALMQSQSATPVRTFAVGFDEREFDESHHARLIARHLGTDHTELTVRGNDVLALVPRMPDIYSEPFADSSQLPTVLLSQLIRRHVNVALSGDGGDELFGGYNRYSLGSRVWPYVSRVPRSVRRVLASGIRALSPAAWDAIGRTALLGDKLHKGAGALVSVDGRQLYDQLLSQGWEDPVVLDADLLPPRQMAYPELSNYTHQMMLFDALEYLPDDILVKVDRAAMAASLETRVPLLDHRVVEFAWSLPLGMKVRNGLTKWILREVLYRHVPHALVDRPKKGFAVPLAQWLRGELRPWAENLLDATRLKRQGYFDSEVITRGWQEHLSGRRNWQQQLWNVLMFQAWLEATP